jgi:hypothetical protein
MMSDDGFAVKAKGPGMIIGTAMDALAQGTTGTIMAYVDPTWWAGDLFVAMPDGSIRMVGEETTLSASTTASALVNLVPSPFFSFESSVYDTASGVVKNSVFRLQNNPLSSTSSLFTLTSSATSSPLLTISDLGDASFAGKIFPAGTNGIQTDASIFYGSATGTEGFMRTNAGGWASKNLEYAEMFPSNQDLKPGQVVVVNPNKPEYVMRSTSPYEGAIIGIVATNPGFLAGEEGEDQYPIALSGRVPIEVTTENGSIESGDYLVASSETGTAMKATKAGPSIAIALEDYDGLSASTTIMAYVYVGWYGGDGEVESVKSSSQPSGTGFARQGFARIAVGDKQVHVSFETIGNYPMITASPHNNPGSWWIENESDVGFTIRLAEAQDVDVIFSWFATPTLEGTIMWHSDADSSTVNTITGQPTSMTSTSSDAPSDTTTETTTTSDTESTVDTTMDTSEGASAETPSDTTTDTTTSDTESTEDTTTDTSAETSAETPSDTTTDTTTSDTESTEDTTTDTSAETSAETPSDTTTDTTTSDTESTETVP